MERFQGLSENKLVALMLEGAELSAEAVAELEEQLVHSPDDAIARVKVLGFFKKTYRNESQPEERDLKHILWMIENHPNHVSFFRVVMSVRNPSDEEKVLISSAWLKQVDQHRSNPVVLGNAGFYLISFDLKQGQALMERAQQLQPENSDWSHWLGSFSFWEMMKPSTSSHAKTELAQQILGYARRLSELSDVPNWINAAAEDWMPKTLELLGDTAGDTSFIAKLQRRNVYPPNRYLLNAEEGLKALEKGHVDAALELLLKEEPRFRRCWWDGSFRKLIQSLCVQGKGEEIIKFLESMDDGAPIVLLRRSAWIEEIRAGRVPDFASRKRK